MQDPAQSDEARLADWEKANQAREQAITQRRQAADQQTRQVFGDVDPNEMGENAIDAVQGAESQARRAKEARYDRVNDLNADSRGGWLWHNVHYNLSRGNRGLTILALFCEALIPPFRVVSLQ